MTFPKARSWVTHASRKTAGKKSLVCLDLWSHVSCKPHPKGYLKTRCFCRQCSSMWVLFGDCAGTLCIPETQCRRSTPCMLNKTGSTMAHELASPACFVFTHNYVPGGLWEDLAAHDWVSCVSHSSASTSSTWKHSKWKIWLHETAMRVILVFWLLCILTLNAFYLRCVLFLGYCQ